MARFGASEAERRLDATLLKRRGWILLVLAALAVIILAPEIETWCTAYRGVVVWKDIEAVPYSTKKSRRTRRARVHRVQVGIVGGTPFWVPVEGDLYDRLKVGTVVSKSYLQESLEVVADPSGPQYATLLARFPFASK